MYHIIEKQYQKELNAIMQNAATVIAALSAKVGPDCPTEVKIATETMKSLVRGQGIVMNAEEMTENEYSEFRYRSHTDNEDYERDHDKEPLEEVEA